MAQRDLAEVQFALGQIPQAEQQVRRAIEVNRQVLGARARGTIVTPVHVASAAAIRCACQAGVSRSAYPTTTWVGSASIRVPWRKVIMQRAG